MSLVQKTTITIEFLRKLIGQFLEKPNIAAVLSAFLDQVQDLENASFEVIENTTLANSEGAQLDGIGKIVGEERQGRSDADYQKALSARILVNISSGTIPELIAIVQAMVGLLITIMVTEASPAAFDLTIDDSISEGAQTGAFVIEAKPAGVLGVFRWFEETPEFRFDTAGKGLDEGKMGGSVSA